MRIKKHVTAANFKIPVLVLYLLLGFVLSTACSSSQKSMKMNVVKDVDLERYAGTWYEIARFSHRFERDLVGVTATYNLLSNGRIEVINQGYKYKLDGELKKAVGKAKVPNPEKPGHLKVSFFWIFYADYLILELDQENYQYVLIGSSSDKYLWILGRTPQMDSETYQMLVGRAAELGYDVDKLELVPQKIP
jgi:apolipoprotein D and lipocalin family protein